MIRYTGFIYSVLLQQNPATAAHAVMIEGWWGVTLSHGISEGITFVIIDSWETITRFISLWLYCGLIETDW